MRRKPKKRKGGETKSEMGFTDLDQSKAATPYYSNMNELPQVIPDYRLLLKLAPEELAEAGERTG